MLVDKEKTIAILKKASLLEKGKEVALAKEFIGIDEKINGVSTQIEGLKSKLNEPLEIELIIE